MSDTQEYSALIVTLSDRAFSGEYEDLSGPRIKERLEEFAGTMGWNCRTDMTLLPDDPEKLRDIVTGASDRYDLIFTTGGTGIGPRDFTVDVIKPLLEKELPGIMDFIRIKYAFEKPNALLSRAVAGVAGKSLVYTLPGSVRAVEEYMTEILRTLEHTLLMLKGVDTHGRHQ
ncbi:MAG: MogA/MoaB family molybdenum cofactor biosynthesis protein [Bacteroidales bacterium]|nr:MogA/MoaB family molybdenum cofactor biosynthesis protein [Bacteroidales bacterium]